MKTASLVLVAAILLASPAPAMEVEVEVDGYVYFNQARSYPLNQVNAGETVTMTFLVDSSVFANSPNFPTRGYNIDIPSYALNFSGGVSVPLMDPPAYPGVPYFVIRNDDPAVDGFFVSHNNLDWPFPGILLDTWGFFGPFENHFDVSYTFDPLPSLDILDALGTWAYHGLTRFYYSVNDGPFDVMGIDFLEMRISLLPVEVPVDIKPGSCPNPINVKSHGVLPVAIMGTAELDVTQLDPASIRLEGTAPLRSSYGDVGTPFEPYIGKSDCNYDCLDWDGDGFMDLTLKFDMQEIVAALGETVDGECRALSLTGNFREEYYGGPIVGEDVVTILVKGGAGPLSESTERDRFVSPPESPAADGSDTVDINKFD